jgi:hypothetical protein
MSLATFFPDLLPCFGPSTLQPERLVQRGFQHPASFEIEEIVSFLGCDAT